MDIRENDWREYLEREVDNRAKHNTPEHVRTTCSFARAERLLGREYHGRFLIELLQNAADATRGASASGSSRVAVWISEGPALLVANKGAPLDAEVIIESLGHIGASTKAEGEAIGHKGIGFKSVLELTLTPEIYSGLQNSTPTLAVGFDPEKALEKIRNASPGWDEWVNEALGLDENDPFAAVPILRFPDWIAELPPDVAELKEKGFDTVVRLPFDGRFTGRLKLDADEWLGTVRGALEGVTDQILLLLGCFDEVHIEDRLAGSETVITPEWEEEPVALGHGATREIVRLRRGGELSSRWRLFRRELPGRPDLSGKVAVGIRVGDEPDAEAVLPAIEGEPSSPFHLFFPTRIPSGLPFLLHAYFEVDAARTGFYRGSASRNKAMLDGVAALTKIAVADAVKNESLDLASLVNRVAEAKEPDDKDAREFRSKVLDHLDRVAWIPLKDGDEGRRSERPERVFADRRDMIRRIGDAFPESYIERRVRLRLPDAKLGDPALELVKNRRPDAPDLWEVVGRLCQPGKNSPWNDADSADEGFLSLIELFEALKGEDREKTDKLLDGLRKDPESQLIPTVGEGNTRKLLPVVDPSERVPGRRSRLVMARTRSTSDRDLIPPDDLEVAFLHDGLLASESEVNRASPLGIRPFTVDTVLDRLSVIEEAPVSGRSNERLVRFLWRLLPVGEASGFDPSSWFWCEPGQVWQDEATRLRRQRERRLAAVPLPCRDGKWRRAGRIAFGADWADWLEERAAGNPPPTTRERVAAYRAMEKVAPGVSALLASPSEILGLLDDEGFEGASSEDGESGSLDEGQWDSRRHAFLLRLGVWEVPPIEAFETRAMGDRRRFVWEMSDRQREIVEKNGGWRFGLDGWRGERHHNVHLAEDYRFIWPLEEMATRSESALVKLLHSGAKLYGERSHALVFCPGCHDGGGSHGRGGGGWRRSTSADGYPSSLAIALRSERWLPCALDGERLEEFVKPESAWWVSKPLTLGGASPESVEVRAAVRRRRG